MSLKKILILPLIMGIVAGNALAINEAGKGLYPEKYTDEYIIENLKPIYKKVSKDEVVYVALDMLNGTSGDFSRKAILGNNLSGHPVKVEFTDLKSFGDEFKDFDALGYKKGKKLYIFINEKHKNAPAGAIAALLSHEALHQDEFNSLAEETYAWTMEAVVWSEIVKLYPELENNTTSALVARENTLKKLYERGKETDKYIKKTVWSNSGYKNLPTTSPGFESL